jgi:hypothetical protein
MARATYGEVAGASSRGVRGEIRMATDSWRLRPRGVFATVVVSEEAPAVGTLDDGALTASPP